MSFPLGLQHPPKVTIEPYEAQHIPLVREFNQRLAGANGVAKFQESNVSSWLPPGKSGRLYEESFLAVDGEAVRGAYTLKHQDFWIKGRSASIASYQFPISEGIINPQFMQVGIQLTTDALQRQPRLFAIGMGGFSEPLPKFLKGMRWSLSEIPLFVKVVRSFQFLRKTAFLRSTTLKKILLDIAAFTGIGWLGIHALQMLKTCRSYRAGLRFEEFREFDDKADILWNQVKQEYPIIGVRDAQNSNLLYAGLSPKFKRINVFEGERYIGWALILEAAMVKHHLFGSLGVGIIADCLSRSSDAAKLLNAAADYLSGRRVDVIVSNHSHKSYRRAFKELGFTQVPSNFLFAASPELARLIEPFESIKDEIYFTRGDGEGPISLDPEAVRW